MPLDDPIPRRPTQQVQFPAPPLETHYLILSIQFEQFLHNFGPELTPIPINANSLNLPKNNLTRKHEFDFWFFTVENLRQVDIDFEKLKEMVSQDETLNQVISAEGKNYLSS